MNNMAQETNQNTKINNIDNFFVVFVINDRDCQWEIFNTNDFDLSSSISLTTSLNDSISDSLMYSLTDFLIDTKSSVNPTIDSNILKFLIRFISFIIFFIMYIFINKIAEYRINYNFSQYIKSLTGIS